MGFSCKKPWTFISMKFYLGEGKKTKGNLINILWNCGTMEKSGRSEHSISSAGDGAN